MAQHIFKGALLINGVDFSTVTRAFEMAREGEVRDNTSIADDDRSNLPGLQTSAFSATMMHDPTYEAVLFALASATTDATSEAVLSFYPGRALAEDELVHFMRGVITRVGKPWELGELAMQSIAGQPFAAGLAGGYGVSRPARGYLSALGNARSASAAGTGRQLGALSGTTKQVVMAGHVLGVTGTATVQFVLESDDNSGFSSATTRATSATFTTGTVGGLFLLPVKGPITDDYWRVRAIIGGTGTATYRVNMARFDL